MSAELVINTEKNLFGSTKQQCLDPYDYLGPKEWVQKQIEYGCVENHISGKELVPHITNLGNSLVGCEIGVCLGFTSEYFLKKIPAIEKIYAVDHYPAFVDWNGGRLTAERQEEIKNNCRDRLSPYGKVELIYKTSTDFAKDLSDNSLDFIFIDGDHSYEATLNDCLSYWPKVKVGGLFAGHDINLPSVQRAIKDFFSKIGLTEAKVTVLENNVWFLIRG